MDYKSLVQILHDTNIDYRLDNHGYWVRLEILTNTTNITNEGRLWKVVYFNPSTGQPLSYSKEEQRHDY